MPLIEVLLFPESGNLVFANFVFVEGMGIIEAGNFQVSMSILASFFFTWWSLSADVRPVHLHFTEAKNMSCFFQVHRICLVFFLMTHKERERSNTLTGLDWAIFWHEKFLASTRLKTACCYCFCSPNSWGRNVGSLPTKLFTLAVSGWCFLSGLWNTTI